MHFLTLTRVPPCVGQKTVRITRDDLYYSDAFIVGYRAFPSNVGNKIFIYSYTTRSLSYPASFLSAILHSVADRSDIRHDLAVATT